ncbi:MAG: hypothetical protein RMK30_08815 [Anaerolineae bacterium]|nr:hypothetical protein [Anaerolineae bacterium]
MGVPAAHIVLRDLYIHHVDEFGMNIQDVEDLQILNCRIEYCGFGALGEHSGWRSVTIRGCSLSWSATTTRAAMARASPTTASTAWALSRPRDLSSLRTPLLSTTMAMAWTPEQFTP